MTGGMTEQEFWALWCAIYSAKEGGRYWKTGADFGVVKNIVKHFGAEKIKLIVETYFDHRESMFPVGGAPRIAHLGANMEDMKKIMKTEGIWEEEE